MVEVNVDKIKEAGKPGNVLMWRKMYNIMCRSCKHKMFSVSANLKPQGTQSVIDGMDKFIKSGMCFSCKNRIDRILERRK